MARRPQPSPARPAPTPRPPAAPPPAARDLPVRSGRLRIGSAVAVLVVSVVAAVILMQRLAQLWLPHPVELDVNQAQLDVQQVLTDPINGYGRDNVTVVSCNNGRNPTVRKGASFTCEVSVDGAERQVTAAFSDDSGTYEVDQPR